MLSIQSDWAGAIFHGNDYCFTIFSNTFFNQEKVLFILTFVCLLISALIVPLMIKKSHCLKQTIIFIN